MRGLILKDFYINKKNWFLSLVVVLVLSIPYFIPLTSLHPDQATLLKLLQIADIIFIYLCFGDAQTSVFSGDERKVWANYIMSSPSTARGQVRSKYCESVFLSVFCALWCICLLNLQDALSDTDTSLKLVILLFFLQFILRALEFPFFIRFGSRHGNYYKLGLLLLIGFLLLIYGLYGDISMLPSFEEMISWSSKVFSKTGNVFTFRFWAVLAGITFLLFGASYCLSCKLYRKGTEGFEG
ncbi:MAG: ABC-2 transporter permease [Lachnospiraceae bacterium]|nr:ABC-2 transporter permease [Lachnospiraceae bacterium]